MKNLLVLYKNKKIALLIILIIKYDTRFNTWLGFGAISNICPH
jgi:hypothetical protein